MKTSPPFALLSSNLGHSHLEENCSSSFNGLKQFSQMDSNLSSDNHLPNSQRDKIYNRISNSCNQRTTNNPLSTYCFSNQPRVSCGAAIICLALLQEFGFVNREPLN